MHQAFEMCIYTTLKDTPRCTRWDETQNWPTKERRQEVEERKKFSSSLIDQSTKDTLAGTLFILGTRGVLDEDGRLPGCQHSLKQALDKG